jgi:uncharacterized protein
MMRVTVAVALAEAQALIDVELPEGASIADALAAAGIAQRWPGLDSGNVGVWGRVARAQAPLRDGDRVEVYRPIKADAKAMRRARAALKAPRRSRSAP